jgi:hypothetical protein
MGQSNTPLTRYMYIMLICTWVCRTPAHNDVHTFRSLVTKHNCDGNTDWNTVSCIKAYRTVPTTHWSTSRVYRVYRTGNIGRENGGGGGDDVGSFRRIALRGRRRKGETVLRE